jgi:hypothetical protein
MRHVLIDVARHGRACRIETTVDGKIKSATVLSDGDGGLPVLLALCFAEREENALGADPHTAMRGVPTTITFHLPSGRRVTFLRAMPEHLLP